MQSKCCACAGDHEAGELEEHMAGCLHSRGSAAQASVHHPILASLPQPQEADLCWLLTASGASCTLQSYPKISPKIYPQTLPEPLLGPHP